jgi:hypothetical protein
VLYLRPNLVALEKAARRKMRFPEGLPPDGAAPSAWMATHLNPSGVIGDPLLASAALGSRRMAPQNPKRAGGGYFLSLPQIGQCTRHLGSGRVAPAHPSQVGVMRGFLLAMC